MTTQPVLVSTTGDLHARAAHALSPSLSAEAQARVAQDPHPAVRYNLAQNPSLDPELQRVLSGDTEDGVRLSLTQNPRLVSEIQQALSKDKLEVVRCWLAKAPAVGPSAQLRLSRDRRKSVRVALASNPALIPVDDMDVSFLNLSPKGRAHLERALRRCDPLTRAAFEAHWKGSLASLLATCQAFAPE